MVDNLKLFSMRLKIPHVSLLEVKFLLNCDLKSELSKAYFRGQKPRWRH